VSGLPPVTSLLAVACLVVALLTAGPAPVVEPASLALDPRAPTLTGVLLWWLAHGSLGHLLTNLTVLWCVGPALERLVGTRASLTTVAVGIATGAAAHTVVHGAGVPLLGSSSVVAALAAYNLVVGWHRPLEDRRGRAVLWPSHLFHAVVLVEVVRVLSELATAAVPTGAAAHLGGVAAGVLLCGLRHGRWPSRPDSRQPVRWRPRSSSPSGRAAGRGGVRRVGVEVLTTGR
jgi:membrane associated rhomboid family serine protease